MGEGARTRQIDLTAVVVSRLYHDVHRQGTRWLSWNWGRKKGIVKWKDVKDDPKEKKKHPSVILDWTLFAVYLFFRISNFSFNILCPAYRIARSPWPLIWRNRKLENGGNKTVNRACTRRVQGTKPVNKESKRASSWLTTAVGRNSHFFFVLESPVLPLCCLVLNVFIFVVAMSTSNLRP